MATDRSIREGSLTKRLGAIAVQFVTIVVGVLVALAADSALERRRLRQATVEALQALRTDVQSDLRQLDEYWEPRLALQEEARTHLTAFLRGTEPISDSLQFVRYVREVATYTTLDPNTAAIEELKSSGRLGLIEDGTLRSEILGYLNAVENIAEFDVLHRALFLELYANLGTSVVGGLAFPTSYRSDFIDDGALNAARAEAATALDAAAIRSNDDLRRLLAATGQPFMIKATRYRALRADAEDLLAALSVALGDE
jgi:hypothetical protein